MRIINDDKNLNSNETIKFKVKKHKKKRTFKLVLHFYIHFYIYAYTCLKSTGHRDGMR